MAGFSHLEIVQVARGGASGGDQFTFSGAFTPKLIVCCTGDTSFFQIGDRMHAAVVKPCWGSSALADLSIRAGWNGKMGANGVICNEWFTGINWVRHEDGDPDTTLRVYEPDESSLGQHQLNDVGWYWTYYIFG